MFDAVMTFFEGKTEGRRMARRSDFTPAELQKYLPNLVLFELKYDIDEVEDIYCQVCGSKCIALYGEVTSTWLSTFEYQDVFIRIKNRCQLAADKCQEFAITTQVLLKDKEQIALRTLYVPLSEDNKRVNKILVFIENDFSIQTQNVAY